ncbi:MAG: hypothetical protein ABIP97_09325, partial [Chthoniobacterales bacterium]
MRFVVILYVLAACFLTASITHCLTRSALEERIDSRRLAILKQFDPKKDTEKINEIMLLSRQFTMRTGM